MNPMWQEWLFWGMSGALFVLPSLLVALLPASPYKSLMTRLLIGTIILVISTMSIILLFTPHILPKTPPLGAFTFSILSFLLIAIPLAITLTMPQSKLRTTMMNGLLWLIGAIALILGIIGAILPVVPTTPFILVTAACWGRASPRFHRWLHQHRYFGPMVRNWEEKRAIPRRAKYLAWSMMSLSSIGLLIKFPERWYVGVGTALVCLCVGLWMARLPDA